MLLFTAQRADGDEDLDDDDLEEEDEDIDEEDVEDEDGDEDEESWQVRLT